MNVVVSGIGIVTPLGSGREKTWSALLDGRSGIAACPHGLEARVADFSPNGARSRMGDFAVLAAAEALNDAGLYDVRGMNIGCAVSQSKPLVDSMDPSLLFASFFGWAAGDVIVREFGLAGPATNVVAACATGIASIETGSRWIEGGLCDIALVGAAESSLNEFYRSGFRQMGVLTEDVSRPFDLHRAGFVMGEGAAVLVLESARHARERGRTNAIRLLSTVLCQSTADALRFDPDGGGVARLIERTVSGHTLPGYVNAHGTGTRFNDLAETRGLKKALGKTMAVSSTKAATGHLLGAAGAVEAAITVLALRDQRMPPTLNLETPDPECDLDYIPLTSRRASFATAMSLSYGFGGQMGAVLFGAAE